jgi:hypothetical protein
MIGSSEVMRTTNNSLAQTDEWVLHVLSLERPGWRSCKTESEMPYSRVH